MKPGTWILISSAAVCGAAAYVAPWLLGVVGAPARPVFVVGLAAVAAGLGMLPVAWLLNRDAARMTRTAARLAAGDDAPVPSVSALSRPAAGALRRVMEQADQDAQVVMARMRELEIRVRISDGDRARFETALEALPDPAIVTNGYGELQLINAAAAGLLGLDREADLSRSVVEAIGDESIRRLLIEAHESGSATHRARAEIAVRAADAPPDAPGRAHEAIVATLPDPTEPIGGAVLILRDIAREREISQMKSEFVSKASHELRTPLSSINAYVEMLLDGEAEDPEAQREFYTVIKSEADRLGRLIDNMLNISRIEAGITKAKHEDVDFVKAAQHAVSVIEPQARLKDISIRIKSGSLLYSAEADRDMLHQVLLNLLSNAVKYTPENGRVTVTIENDETTGSVMTTVADTGLGIPPDAIDHVFDKFYRIENYKRVAKGTGLGLNLVKHIVETVHGGQITVTSELGMGSKFTFLIPYTRDGARRLAA